MRGRRLSSARATDPAAKRLLKTARRGHGARPSASTITLSAPVDNLTAKREAQTAADLAQAQQLAEEARQLIVGDYAKAAREIAETLERLATIESEVRALNARLPAYTGYIQIEAFRGHGPTLGQTVVLPSSTSDDQRALREELIAPKARAQQ